MSKGNDINDGRVADAVERHWADHVLIRPLRPYARLARLERPIGWWLLLLPGWWSIGLAASFTGALPDLRLLLLFLIGAVVMRGAGCTFNDIVDREFDAKVERTRSRPIPSGQVTLFQAVAFMAALCLVGLIILVQFNEFAILLGVLSLITVIIYPFMKRFTYWPQIFLGISFNWGALLGWAAVTGQINWPAIVLYFGGIFWTLAYDTIYAHQDKEDDLLVGIKSTALRLGDKSRFWISVFWVFALTLITLSGLLANAGIVFLGGVCIAAAHAAWQIHRLDINDPDRCLMLFRSNQHFGLIIFAGIVLDSIFNLHVNSV